MITMSNLAAAAVTTAAASIRSLRVEAWLGDELLADDVPVTSATEDGDASLRVPERLTLAVPALDGVTSWIPTTAGAPLGAFGQRLRVLLGVDVGAGAVEWINRGWFVLNTAATEDDVITVEALGLLALVD